MRQRESNTDLITAIAVAYAALLGWTITHKNRCLAPGDRHSRPYAVPISPAHE